LIAGRLRKRGCPLLPVLVVADTGQPFMGEMSCRLWGLVGKDAIGLEQQRCFDFDWPSAFFQRQTLLRRAVLQAWNAMADALPRRPSALPEGSAATAPRDVSDLAQADMIRHQADKLVDEFPDDALGVLAADLESDTEHQEGLARALAIAAELRRRAAAGVRKWPAPKG
jgi:hypothetical protein